MHCHSRSRPVSSVANLVSHAVPSCDCDHTVSFQFKQKHVNFKTRREKAFYYYCYIDTNNRKKMTSMQRESFGYEEFSLVWVCRGLLFQGALLRSKAKGCFCVTLIQKLPQSNLKEFNEARRIVFGLGSRFRHLIPAPRGGLLLV